MFYWPLFAFTLICGFFCLDGPGYVKEKYDKFRQLNQFVATRYRTTGMILWVSCSMVAKMYWLKFLQWLNNSVEYLNKKTAVITYTLNGRVYKMVARIKRGPTSILTVTTDNNEDVTDQILPYLGPNEDWHGSNFTPQFWNYNMLTFELASGESITFTRDTPIQFVEI